MSQKNLEVILCILVLKTALLYFSAFKSEMTRNPTAQRLGIDYSEDNGAWEAIHSLAEFDDFAKDALAQMKQDGDDVSLTDRRDLANFQGYEHPLPDGVDGDWVLDKERGLWTIVPSNVLPDYTASEDATYKPEGTYGSINRAARASVKRDDDDYYSKYIGNTDYESTKPMSFIDYTRSGTGLDRSKFKSTFDDENWDTAGRAERRAKIRAQAQLAHERRLTEMDRRAELREQEMEERGEKEYEYPNAGTQNQAIKDAEELAYTSLAYPDGKLVNKQFKSSRAFVALSSKQKQDARIVKLLAAVQAANIPHYTECKTNEERIKFARAAVAAGRKHYEESLALPRRGKLSRAERRQRKKAALEHELNPASLFFPSSINDPEKHQENLRMLDGADYTDFLDEDLAPEKLAIMTKERKAMMRNHYAGILMEILGALNIGLRYDEKLTTVQSARVYYNPNFYILEMMDVDGNDLTPAMLFIWEKQRQVDGTLDLDENGKPKRGKLIAAGGYKIIDPSPQQTLATYKTMQYMVEHPTPAMRKLESKTQWNKRVFRLTPAELNKKENLSDTLSRVIREYMQEAHYINKKGDMYFVVCDKQQNRKDGVYLAAKGPAASTLLARFARLFLAWFIHKHELRVPQKTVDEHPETPRSFEEKALAVFKDELIKGSFNALGTDYLTEDQLAPDRRQFYKDAFIVPSVYDKIYGSRKVSAFYRQDLIDMFATKEDDAEQDAFDLHIQVLLTITILDLMNVPFEWLELASGLKIPDILLWAKARTNLSEDMKSDLEADPPRPWTEIPITPMTNKALITKRGIKFWGTGLIGKPQVLEPEYDSKIHKLKYNLGEAAKLKTQLLEPVGKYLKTSYRGPAKKREKFVQEVDDELTSEDENYINWGDKLLTDYGHFDIAAYNKQLARKQKAAQKKGAPKPDEE